MERLKTQRRPIGKKKKAKEMKAGNRVDKVGDLDPIRCELVKEGEMSVNLGNGEEERSQEDEVAKVVEAMLRESGVR